MRRAIMVGLLLGTVTISHADWFEYNPDHAPSIGLTYSGAMEDGDATVTDGPISVKQNVDAVSGMLVLDTRVPVSDNLTLHGAIGVTGTEIEATETPDLLGGKTETGGVFFSLGARIYFSNRPTQQHASMSRPVAPVQRTVKPVSPTFDWQEDALPAKDISDEDLLLEMDRRGLIKQ